MDTLEKYHNAELCIMLSKDRFTDRDLRIYNRPEGRSGWLNTRKEHPLGENPKVDGWLLFYDPDAPEGEPWKYYDFPFRSVNKDDDLWFAYPDREKFTKQPVWKWQNPDESISELTLKPSIGVNADDELTFHCFVENGEIEWL